MVKLNDSSWLCCEDEVALSLCLDIDHFYPTIGSDQSQDLVTLYQ